MKTAKAELWFVWRQIEILEFVAQSSWKLSPGISVALPAEISASIHSLILELFYVESSKYLPSF